MKLSIVLLLKKVNSPGLILLFNPGEGNGNPHQYSFWRIPWGTAGREMILNPHDYFKCDLVVLIKVKCIRMN